jgi:hypothetical protein
MLHPLAALNSGEAQEQETAEKKPVRDQIGDQLKQRIQRGLSVREESKHGLSRSHRVGLAEKYLVLAGLVFGFLSLGSVK